MCVESFQTYPFVFTVHMFGWRGIYGEMEGSESTLDVGEIENDKDNPDAGYDDGTA